MKFSRIASVTLAGLLSILMLTTASAQNAPAGPAVNQKIAAGWADDPEDPGNKLKHITRNP